MPFLTYQHDKIFYKLEQATESDHPEVIVFIHTNITDHTLFDSITPLLNKRFTILRYDLRGFGQTQTVDNEPSINQYVKDLQFLVNTLNIKGFHLLGLGSGALIAAAFTQHYEEYVQSLILLSLPCNPPEIIENIRSHRRKISNNGKSIPLEYILNIASTLPNDHPEMVRLQDIIRSTPPAIYARMMDITVGAQPIPDLQAIHVPVLVLSGEKDIVFPHHYLEANIALLPNYRYFTIPYCSNFIVMDKPQTSADLIRDFINGEKRKYEINDDFLKLVDEETRTYGELLSRNRTASVTHIPELKVELIQTFRIFVNDKEVIKGWNQRFAKPILIYLLFHPSTTREQLCETLWPETSIKQAKKNLTVYLSYLKRLLKADDEAEPVIITDREYIHLNGAVSCDLLNLYAKLEQAQKEKDMTVKFHSGQELLQNLKPGYLLATYENWFLDWQMQMENRLVDLVIWMADYLLETDQGKQAIRHLEKCLSLLDDNDVIYDKIIRFYRQIGDEKAAQLWLDKKEKIWKSME